MSTDIRTHLGSRCLALVPQRDWPAGVVQSGQEENETWLYEDGKPVRRLSFAEAWNLTHPPERRIPCPTY